MDASLGTGLPEVSNVDVDRLLEEAGVELDAGSPLEESWDAEGMLGRLGAHVRREWEAARRAKEHHEKEMLACLRQRNGQYEPDVLDSIRQMGGSEIYMMLTQVKCRATESWMLDILLPSGGEVPFAVEVGSEPELQPEHEQMIEQRVNAEAQEAVQMGIYVEPARVQERIEEIRGKLDDAVKRFAKERARGMQERLESIAEQGGFKDALKEMICNAVTYPAGILKGPTRVVEKTMNWAIDEFGQTHAVVKDEIVRKYSAPSPFDIFPSQDSRWLGDGSLIERCRYRRSSLYSLIGAPGYDEDAIREVIRRYGDTGYRLEQTGDTYRDYLEGRHGSEWGGDRSIEAINYWGEVRGRWLLDWGMPESMIPDPDADYQANVIMVDDLIIRAALNPHPLGAVPFWSMSIESIPNQVWGKGIPQLIRDSQDMANSAARSLENNMALASGPFGEAQVDRFAEGETVMPFHPWRMYQTTESKVSTTSRPAISWYQPNSNAGDLMEVYKFFSDLADEYSGIPPYATGSNEKTGAAATVGGLRMLQENAGRGIKRGTRNADKVIEGTIQFTFEDVMLWDDDPDIKGDMKIVATASTSLVNRERQAMRKNELAQITAGNPIDQQILGLIGRRNQLADLFRTYDVDAQGILPSEDEIRKRMMAVNMPPEPEPEHEMG